MKSRFINTVQAETEQQKYYAYRNAQTRNTVNKSHYSTTAQIEASRVADMLASLYCSTSVYTNYRKTKVAVKLCTKAVLNKKLLREYESYLVAQKWEKTVSAQGIVYSKKAANF